MYDEKTKLEFEQFEQEQKRRLEEFMQSKKARTAPTVAPKKADTQKVVGLDKERAIVETAIRSNFAVLIEGETGQGKTYLLTQVVQSLGRELIRFSVNKNTGIEELVGRWHIRDGTTYWVDGVLTLAMRSGSVLLIDEINIALPEVLTALFAVLDDGRALVIAEKDGERVVPHENFRIVATCNPTDEYAGTRELSKALLSRFPVKLQIQPYAPTAEKEIIELQSGVDDATARIIVDCGNAIRELKRDDKITYTMSTRDLVSWGRVLMADGLSLEVAFEVAVLNKAHREERRAIVDAVNGACKVVIPWSEGKQAGRSLTATLAKSIEKLETERRALEAKLTELETATRTIKEAVQNDTL